ncbi:MAG: threonine synthase [Hyphomicrobiales bacterium]|nr:MAG: threonine synthase [Hyphomicrobiales bacterium]
MKYVSTRGNAPALGFCDVLLTGLARDGGLYVPEEWPVLDAATIRSFAGKPYAEIAKTVLAPFVEGEIPEADFAKMVDDAYASFHHKAVVPLVQISANTWILELFHGPTLAFKDVAMQLVGPLMDYALAERNEKATVVCATSGDTGGAAIEAFRGRENTDIFVLFPKGKVSRVQQRQMTTVYDANVHPIAIEGNFDDCQALVKAMFNHHGFRDRVKLSGVNSINWARIMSQIVYYFSAAASLGAPEREVSFTVPTGNFGDIFAGYVAQKMGLPIEKLIIATNQNDILARTLETGRYEVTGVEATQSPSMDIQISSNFERLLFELYGRDSNSIERAMSGLSQSGAFSIDEEPLAQLRAEFSAGRCSETETADTIRQTLADCDYLLDPHSAVAVHVAKDHPSKGPMIVLSTAHPAKFPTAVKKASGIHPALPEWQQAMMEREEKFTVLENSLEAVEAFISENGRI